MKRRPISFFLLIFTLFAIAPAIVRSAEPATAPSGIYDQLVQQYMQGRWDDILTELVDQKKEIAALPAAQRTAIEGIRKAIAESRPAWWEVCKRGGRTQFRPMVWDMTLPTRFDPFAKTSVQINFVNGDPSLVVKWDVADMDNPAQAEHGFTKGELNDLDIWSTLGTAQAWANIPLRLQSNLDEAGRANLSRYLGFR